MNETENLKELIRHLKSKDSDKRDQAAVKLALMGEDAAPAVPALIKALVADEWHPTSNALWALGEIGSGARDAVNEIVSRIDVGSEFSETLAKIGDVGIVPELMKALKSETLKPEYFGARKYAAALLWKFDKERVSENALRELAATDENDQVRFVAKWALENMGKSDEEAIAALIVELRKGEGMGAAAAADTLCIVGESAVPELIRCLNDAHFTVRVAAASVLRKIGRKAAAAVPDLLNSLKHEYSIVGESAALALGRIGDTTVVPVLMDSLGDYQISVVDAVSRLAPEKGKMARLLYDFQAGDSRYEKVAPLARIGEPAIPYLLKLIDKWKTTKENRKLAWDYAVEALWKMGKVAVPALVTLLKSDYRDLRNAASNGIARLGERAVDALPALLVAATDSDERVRANVALALGKLGVNDSAVTPMLLKLSSDESANVRRDAVWSLGRVNVSLETVSAICANLGDDDRHMWQTAMNSLMEIGPAAIPFIVKASGTKPELRRRALLAIDGIAKKTGRPSGVRQVDERPQEFSQVVRGRVLGVGARPQVVRVGR